MAWVKTKAAARYAGISERTFRDWLKLGLRYSKLPSGTILIKLGWIDEFLSGFEVADGGNQVDQIVSETLKELKL